MQNAERRHLPSLGALGYTEDPISCARYPGLWLPQTPAWFCLSSAFCIHHSAFISDAGLRQKTSTTLNGDTSTAGGRPSGTALPRGLTGIHTLPHESAVGGYSPPGHALVNLDARHGGFKIVQIPTCITAR